jgi:Flp pilus assembly protein TadD
MGPSRAAEAIPYAMAALALKPNSSGVQNQLGVALKTVGRDVEAELAFRRAIDLKNDLIAGHHNLGNLSSPTLAR